MTRLDAKIKLFEIIENGFINFNEKGLINEIYDDFESRTCENCKYYMPNGLTESCKILDILERSDFGYNKWEQNNVR